MISFTLRPPCDDDTQEVGSVAPLRPDDKKGCKIGDVWLRYF